MTRTLYVETSITGGWQFRLPNTDDLQPHMTRLAWLATGDAGHAPRDWCRLIKPKGNWRFEASQIVATGINRGWGEDHGVPLIDAMRILIDELARADELVAFNMDFHWRVLERSAWQCHLQLPLPPHAFCAMLRSVDAVSKGRRPKRAEAYWHFARAPLPVMTGDPVEHALAMIHTLETIWRGIRAAEKQEKPHE